MTSSQTAGHRHMSQPRDDPVWRVSVDRDGKKPRGEVVQGDLGTILARMEVTVYGRDRKGTGTSGVSA